MQTYRKQQGDSIETGGRREGDSSEERMPARRSEINRYFAAVAHAGNMTRSNSVCESKLIVVDAVLQLLRSMCLHEACAHNTSQYNSMCLR